MRCLRAALCLAIVLVATLIPATARAVVDGFMIRVIADRAEIKLDGKVLASVPKGTRLWAFEVKDREWVKVKVPGENDKGWLHYTDIEQIKLTDPDKSKQAREHLKKFLDFASRKELRAATAEMEAYLAIERDLKGADHPDIADMLNHLGSWESDQGDYSTARKYQEEALAIHRKVFGNEHTETAATLNNLAILVEGQGDYAAARKYYEESLAICRKQLGNDPMSALAMLSNLGIVARKQGDYASSRKYLEEALATCRKAHGNDSADTAVVLEGIGSLDEVQGDYAAARKCFEEALAILRKVRGNESRDTAAAINNLGLVARDQGHYAAARKYFEEALVARRKILGNEHPETAASVNNVGVMADNLGDYATARKCFEESLAIYRSVLGNAHPETANTLSNLGNSVRAQGDYAAARKYLIEALAIYRKVLGNKHPDTARTLINMALVLSEENNTTGAADYMDQARHALRFHEVRTLPALSQQEQVQFLEHNHNQDWVGSLAFGLSQRSDQRIAELSTGWLVNGKAVGEESLAEAALLNRPETTPLVARLRVVRANLAELVRKPEGAERERQLAALEQEQQQLVRELGRARGEDFTADPWVAVEEVRHAVPTKSLLVNIARFAPYDFKTKKRGSVRYVAWLIPHAGDGEIKIIELGDAEPIDTAVGRFRKAMSVGPSLGRGADRPDEKDNERAANDALQETINPLSEMIWQPLAEHVAGKDELILSPDGALWLVPWAALPIDNGKFLLERYKLRYVVSGRELVGKSSAGKMDQKSVVMANPDYDMNPESANAAPQPIDALARRSVTRLGQANRLPGTAKEAKAIEPSLAKYTHSKPLVYLDRYATEGRFKQLVSPRVLVLGTHGYFFEDQKVEAKDDDRLPRGSGEDHRPLVTKEGKPIENPLLRCGLLLAGCNRQDDADAAQVDDGVLTGLEIVGTDLRGTELVVLSACETGVGEIRSGEGVAGLRQAFQLAGAQSVVATLWQIPDKETAQLMNDFFVYLSQGKSRSEALRYAQLAQIKSRREKYGAAHPYYWAAFTLTGTD